MNIYEFQIMDHRRFLYFLDILVSREYTEPLNDFLREVQAEILAYNMAEEEILFEVLKISNGALIKIIEEIKNNHKKLEELSSSDISFFNWKDTLMQMIEVLRSNIYKEENILFPEAKKILSLEESINMAEDMALRKIELKNSIFSKLSHNILEKVGFS